MTKKAFFTKFNCTDADLEQRINDGWDIQFMQGMANDKLLVVFVREIPQTAAEADGETVVEPVVAAAPRPIASRPPVPMTILGLDQPAYGKPYPGHSSPMPKGDCVPEVDPVMAEALRRGREAFDRKMAEGSAAIHEAAKSFNKYVQ